MMIFVRLFFEFLKSWSLCNRRRDGSVPLQISPIRQAGSPTDACGHSGDLRYTRSDGGVMATYVGFTTKMGSCWCSNCYTRSDHTVHYRDPDHCWILKGVQNKQVCSERFLRTLLRPASTGLIAAAGLSVLSLVLLHKDALRQADHRPDQHPQYHSSSCSTLLFHGSLQKTKGLPSGCVYCGIR